MLKKIIKFAITGGLGTITNLILFMVFADFLKFQPHIVNLCCFLISCTQNYCINHLWTFKVENAGEKLSFRLWLKFVAGSLFGYAVNFCIFSVLLHYFDWQIEFAEKTYSIQVIPQGIGILCGMVINFIFSNFFVFKTSSKKTDENS